MTISRTMNRFLVLVFLGMIFSCTHEEVYDEIPEHYMPFILPLAVKEDKLFVVSTNYDGSYNPQNGKLAQVNIAELNTALTGSSVAEKTIIIDSNVNSVGVVGQNLLLLSGQSNSLAMAKLGSSYEISCNEKKLSSCTSSSKILLKDSDPHITHEIDQQSFLVAYKSCEKVDFFKTNASKPEFSIILRDFFENPKDHEHYDVSGIKTVLINGVRKTYFAVNRRLRESYIRTHKSKPKSFIFSIKTDEIIGNKIDKKNTLLVDLDKSFGVSSIADFCVHKNGLFLLAKSPQNLYHMDLEANTLLKVEPVGEGANMMACSKLKDLMVVPCFDSGEVMAYSFKGGLKKTAYKKYSGASAAYAVISDKYERVFVSFFHQHQVRVFDLELNFKGSLFQELDE